MTSIAPTPDPPYVAVIFTSLRTPVDGGYAQTAAAMDRLAAAQDGYLGHESAREGIGITVSYWRDESAALAWKDVAAHLAAQHKGRDSWYSDYTTRIAVVHRAYTKASSPLIESP
jgi:heme-degrading monooxygenase HmoA